MGQMDNSGTEDLGVMARLMYGYVLSNEAVLGPKETSFVLISGLIPQDVSIYILELLFQRLWIRSKLQRMMVM